MAPIHDAVRAGDVEAVRRELAAGVSPDLRASTLNSSLQDLPNLTPVWTPLCIALVYRSSYQSGTALLETVSLLIEAGADVDAVCGDYQYTAMWVAVRGGRRDLVATLIAAGASTSLHVEVNSSSFPPTRPVELEFNSRPVELEFNSHQLHIIWQLLQAGSPLPRIDRTKWMQPDAEEFNSAAAGYANAVAAAGGYVAYEKAHRAKLAAIFVPKLLQLPAEVIPTIVEFWAYTGHP